MERGLTHLLHAAILGVVLYVLMVYVLKQSTPLAENRSILIAAVALIYMILFGHGLPKKLNANV